MVNQRVNNLLFLKLLHKHQQNLLVPVPVVRIYSFYDSIIRISDNYRKQDRCKEFSIKNCFEEKSTSKINRSFTVK